MLSRGAKNLKALGIEPPTAVEEVGPLPPKRVKSAAINLVFQKPDEHTPPNVKVCEWIASVPDDGGSVVENRTSELVSSAVTSGENPLLKNPTSELVSSAVTSGENPLLKNPTSELVSSAVTSGKNPLLKQGAKRQLSFSDNDERKCTKEKVVTQVGNVIRVENGDDDFNPRFYVVDESDDDIEPLTENLPDDAVQLPTEEEPDVPVQDVSEEEPEPEVQEVSEEERDLQPMDEQGVAVKPKKRNYQPRPKTRRRLKQKSKKQIRKEARGAGLAYVTEKGKEKAGKEVGRGCPESCKRCEDPRLTKEEREGIFRHFWSLKTNELKWDYISRLVATHEPKTNNTLPEKARGAIRRYTFKVGDSQRRVCKTMFLQTLNINHSWVDTALRKPNEKGSITPDKRGGHHNRPNRSTEGQLQSCRDHIDSIQRVPSHYSRERNAKEYFEAGLNFEELYRMYKEWVKEKNVKAEDVATKSQYHEVFMTEYNIGFHVPLKDRCLIHGQWLLASEAEKREMADKYEAHCKSHNAVKKIKNEEKARSQTDKTFCVSCFDLEKVLNCPRCTISVMFYKTKLSLYNFTIFDLAALHGYCYLWDETTAGRGANEIASMLLMYVESKESQGCKTFSFYSDSPTGQNRNRMVFLLWLYAAVKFGIEITHRFFETGHSFSEVDAMHGRIETEAKHREVYHPDDWASLIVGAKKNGETYSVTRVTQEMVFEFHEFVARLDWKKDTNNQKVRWSEVKQVRASPLHPTTLFFKYDLAQQESSIVVNRDPEEFDVGSYELGKAYSAPIPLAAKKVSDLQSILDLGIIPHQHRPFYQRLVDQNK